MASDLQVKTSPRPQSRLALEVVVPAERCQRSYDKTVRNLCRTVRLPGFRRGRVPRTAVLQQLGPQQVWITALEQLLEDTAQDVLNDEDLNLLGKLQLQDSFDDLAQRFKPGEGLTLNMEADVRPNAALKAYRDLEVEVEELSVEDLLEQVFKQQRLAASTKVPVEKTTAEMGDVAVIQLGLRSTRKTDEPDEPDKDESDEPDEADEADEADESGAGFGFSGSRGLEVDLVENHQALGEFVPLIIGMTVGETRMACDYIDEEDLDDDDDLINDTSITLCGLKERRLPELNDAFAQEVSKFATMAEWEDALSPQLEIRVQENNKVRRQEALLDAVCEDLEVELPRSLVEQEMGVVMEDFMDECEARGLNPEDLKSNDSFRERAEAAQAKEVQDRLHRKLALETVARTEQLTVTDTELEEGVRDLRRQIKSKRARKLDPTRLRAFVKMDLLREKALAWLEEHNTFKAHTAPVENGEEEDGEDMESNPAPAGEPTESIHEQI